MIENDLLTIVQKKKKKWEIRQVACNKAALIL